MKVYIFDENGLYKGISETDKNPIIVEKKSLIEKLTKEIEADDEELFPAYTTDIEPLPAKEGYNVIFQTEYSGQGNSKKYNCKWVYEKIETIEEQKISGKLPLAEGEKIVLGKLVIMPSPGDTYSWNYDTKEWYLDEAKVKAKAAPSSEEVLNAQIELKAIELLTELGVI